MLLCQTASHNVKAAGTGTFCVGIAGHMSCDHRSVCVCVCVCLHKQRSGTILENTQSQTGDTLEVETSPLGRSKLICFMRLYRPVYRQKCNTGQARMPTESKMQKDRPVCSKLVRKLTKEKRAPVRWFAIHILHRFIHSTKRRLQFYSKILFATSETVRA